MDQVKLLMPLQWKLVTYLMINIKDTDVNKANVNHTVSND